MSGQTGSTKAPARSWEAGGDEAAGDGASQPQEVNPPRRVGIRGWASRLRQNAGIPRGPKATAVLSAAVLLAIGAGAYLWQQADGLPDGTALRIDDRDVSTEELDGQADRMRALYGVQPPADPAKFQDFQRGMAKAYAVRVVLDRQAEREGIAVPEKSVQEMLSRYISQQLGDGPDAHDNFVKALGGAGTSETAVHDEIKHMLTADQLFARHTQGTAVGDDDVRRAFDARRSSLGTPEQRTIKNIVVRTQDDANEVMTRLNSGSPFEEVARSTSLDDQTRQSGGDLGTVTADKLDPAFSKAAFTAATNGAVFGPVQTQHGWNVGKVVAARAPAPAEFAAVQGRLKQQLAHEKAMDRWREVLGRWLQDADVEYADGYRPADPLGPPAAAGSGSPGASAPGHP